MALRKGVGTIWLPIYEFDDHKYTDSGYFLSIDYNYYNNLMERKEQVIRLIDEKGMLTDEIKSNILEF